MFVKNTVAKGTAAAKTIVARKKCECTGFGKYLTNRMERNNDHEIDEWYAD